MRITTDRKAAQASPSNRHEARKQIRSNACVARLFDDSSIEDGEQWITDTINEWVDELAHDLEAGAIEQEDYAPGSGGYNDMMFGDSPDY